ncbi:DUF559 domain-containing protein [Gordonia sp. NB41Y]|uniref:endonuclease domain-containing protein n=1 Tax=Gordonia sp. NB41Y TaxID=875808 RepID=UPI0002BDE91B|nr:DUF559 domain-containing protein [Gordonia sp. NB41Y]EMP14762.1 hypothetical protein ISGA_905 [Gordonia sp. NB41Y]WLP92119.1 DUF559 domain-containing protein [Gordonia sp. NB41Y]
MLSDGVYTWAQLLGLGLDQTAIRHHLADKTLTKLRHGWYSTPDADIQLVEAVRLGGALTCLTALARHGVWIPDHPREIHIRGGRSAHAEHPRRFCRSYDRPFAVTAAVDDAQTALRHALRCLDDEGIVIVVDSLLDLSREPSTRVLTPAQVTAAFTGAPQRVRRCLDLSDGRAQSGTETLVRLRLRRRGIKVRPQVFIPDLGRVDLLVGDRLIIEVDSVAHHTGAENYAEDRRRDQVAARLGYLRMRLTYSDVVFNWARTEETIIATVRAGHHRGPRQRKPVQNLAS